MAFSRRNTHTADYSEVVISVASSKDVLAASHGEVTEPETKNHRTYNSEPRGLFCPIIFGPEENWKCACGKYKGIKYKLNVCDRCGVEVNEKSVRRERKGHIHLVVPAVNPLFFRYLPNKIGALLGISSKKLEAVVYYSQYIVIQPGIKEKDGVGRMDFLSPKEYQEISDSLPAGHEMLADNDEKKFIAKMGAEAVEMLLKRIDLEVLAQELREKVVNETSQQRRADAIKRLNIVEAFRQSNKKGVENKPESMVIRYLLVISPELRPILPLSNGRFATSDITELLKRLVMRNNRLKKLIDLKAPEIILLNEKRMLQEIVDAVIDNSTRINTITTENGRPLKSLTSNLKGKSGRFRQNLLGKRVDFSGRSVIVVGPELKLHECGIPKEMALTLFKPFVIQRLKNRGIANTFKEAQALINKKDPVVWDVLEGQMKSHPVLLNRAPTLHRLSIQAFMPKLIEGKAIQLHPLVCTAFNADFDGDQMAVHVPLSQEAIAEATLLMLSSKNLLDPANGEPIMVPSKDMVLGLYYITKGKEHTAETPVVGEGMIFSSVDELIIAMDQGKVSKHAKVKLKTEVLDEYEQLVSRTIDTVAGRAIFNKCVPKEMGFINELLDSKKIRSIVSDVYKKVGVDRTAVFLDQIKDLGFHYAHEGGLTYGLDDIKIPSEKTQMIEDSMKEVEQVWESYFMGIITNMERYNQIVDIWTKTNIDLTKILIKNLEEDKDGFNTIFMMMDSGARGSREQVKQVGGMRGLMARPNKSNGEGSVIETPVLANFTEGLDVQAYFISTHGARKGLSDSALRTADAGYLTRKLVDVAQSVVITGMDCGTLRGRKVRPLYENGKLKMHLGDKILGRIAAKDIIDPATHEVVVHAGEEINEAIAQQIDERDIRMAEVRSPLYCEGEKGLCVQCYGRDLATGGLVELGEAAGTVAANSIAQPGTQLTLRTFHTGGVASNVMVRDVVEAPEDGQVEISNLKVVPSPADPTIMTVVSKNAQLLVKNERTPEDMEPHVIPYGASLFVKHGKQVKTGEKLFKWDPYNGFILSDIEGKVYFEAIEAGVTFKEEYDEQTGYKEKIIIDGKGSSQTPNIIIKSKDGKKKVYALPVKAYISIDEGEIVKQGQVLAKIPRAKNVHQDITGGLPRVTELFEARNPTSAAIVTEIEGIISYGSQKRRNQEIIVTAKDGSTMTYKVPFSKQILVQEGDFVRACSPLSDGFVPTEKILQIQGYAALYEYMVEEVQEVYRLQGVKIDDKHIEIIIRQMMQKVEIIRAGDTLLLENQLVSKDEFNKSNEAILGKRVIESVGDSSFRIGQIVPLHELESENKRLASEKLALAQARPAKPAIGEPKLQGITRSSITGDSFLAAASFQETVKVLIDAAIGSKVDRLEGLKENVLLGRLIPAGTGLPHYRKMRVMSKEVEESLVKESFDLVKNL